MGDGTNTPTQIIALPQGGGATKGLGEKFAPDLHTGTGNHTVPIEVPAGRRGHEPRLDLVYSSGSGNGSFGVGWSLTVPGVARKTSQGVPRYTDDADTFILSGAEDLVVVDASDPDRVRYRPRTEGPFAHIVHRRDVAAGIDCWEVSGTNGMVSRYGSLPPEGGGRLRDPATITDPADPADPQKVFAWKLTETRDPLGNVIVYEYDADEGDADGHRWRQPLLRAIRYADIEEGGTTRFLAAVTFDYAEREDAFSDYRAGFEIRTTRLCRAITTSTHAEEELLVRRYELEYDKDAHNGASLLRTVRVVGFDDAGAEHRDLPPVRFEYSGFDPDGRRFEPLRGTHLPAGSMGRAGCEVVDLTSDGLPDLLEWGATGARWWRNLGDGRFDRPRTMGALPVGAGLADPGTQLLDTDGNGRVDLLVNAAGQAGEVALRFDGTWGRFRPYRSAPSFDLEDPQVRTTDLTGDGITDVVRAGTRLECWFHEPGPGWSGPRPARVDGAPPPSFDDPRVKLADMTGDGLQDIVLARSGAIVYWPNLGHGRWGSRLRMADSPRLPDGHVPARLLLGDVDGDGGADLIYVDDDATTVWFNRSGNGWSAPVTVKGTPRPGTTDDLRVVDLLGSGTGGVLFTRDNAGDGRPSMFFLDLTGGTKPRLLNRIENGLGALTEIEYLPSSRFAAADALRPATRWRTALPIVVPVVARVVVHDEVSEGSLTSEFRYHHGCWDGLEREFRGFGCVEQTDTVTADTHPAGSTLRSSPTLTKTWFHVGPLDDRDGWAEPDWSAEYWDGDKNLLRHADIVRDFLTGLRASGADRRAERDALRALRGRVLRTELYGLDGTVRASRPYTVTEHAHGVREEPSATPESGPRVFFSFPVAERTTQWERGDDPMTRFSWIGDYDQFGRSLRRTSVAPPRRSACRQPWRAAVAGEVGPDPEQVLATHVRTAYASPPDGVYIHDRVAEVTTWELVDPPEVDEQEPDDVGTVLADQAAGAAEVDATFAALDPDGTRVIGHVLNLYDGAAFTGLECGQLGSHGLLTRMATLVHTEHTLAEAYGDERPEYLGGDLPLPDGAPDGFAARLGYHKDPAGPGFLPGWYADTVSRAYDVQLGVQPARGLTLQTRDPLENETTITPDRFHLLPETVTDPAGLSTTVEYNRRTGRPARVTDPNGTETHYGYHPLGLLGDTFLRDAAGQGGTAANPDVRHQYDLAAFVRAGEPISVHTSSRIWHATDGVSDETIETREYSDGFGRLMQTQRQADDLAFGDTGDNVGLLVADDEGTLRPVPGQVSGPAVGDVDSERVVVSGWQVYDDKGRVAEKYEPFLASGWGLRSAQEAARGRRVRLAYDPRGHLTRTVNPDGSERRILFGTATDRNDPDAVEPSAWVTTTWDENDLAAHSVGPDNGSLADGAPAAHYGTPTIALLDGFGRTVATLALGGDDPDRDGLLTRTRYDTRGNAVQIVDEHGRQAFDASYDLTSRVVRTDNIDAGRRASVFDAAGNPVHAWDSRGCATLRGYDGANRPTTVHAREAPDAVLTLRERLTYGDEDPDRDDALRAHRLGRLWQHLDDAGLQVAESYDFAGRLTSHARRVVSDAAIAAAEPDGWTANWDLPDAQAALEPAGSAHRTGTRYDALGRAVEIAAPALVNGQPARISPTYGRSGDVQSVVVNGDPYIRFVSHNARGQRVLVGYGNGLFTRYAYHPDTFRLSRLRTETATMTGDVWTGTGPVLQDLTYGYDLVGNVTTIEERTTGCGVANGPHGRDRLVREFGYDAFYRLISATGRACATIGTHRPLDDGPRCGSYPAAPDQNNAPDVTTGYRESYTYDPAGNLVALLYQVTTGPSTPSWHRSYDIGDRPAAESAQAPTNRVTSVRQGGAGEAVPLGYDDGGNLTTQSESRVHVWDHAGRLVGFRVQAGTGTSIAARYLYGADGVRVKKWVRRGDTPSLDESTVWIGDLVEQHGWAENGGGRNSVLKVITGQACAAMIRSGPPRPRDASPEVMYTLADHLGSATVTLDGSGTWLVREEYFAYGETSFGGFARKRYRFCGMERDEESGLAYRRARYYAPGLGRWVSPDPAGTVDGLNLYRYARLNPLSYVDPAGHAADKPDVSGTEGSPPEPSAKHKLGGNANYGEKVENRKELGHNVQGDHPVRVELRKEQRTAPDGTEHYTRSVSKQADPVIGPEKVVLVETGKGKMHTELGKAQRQIIDDVKSGKIRHESDLLDGTRQAYEDTAKQTGATYDRKGLDTSLLSNQAKMHVSTAETVEELKKVPHFVSGVPEHALEGAVMKPAAVHLGKAEVTMAKKAYQGLGHKALKIVPVIGIYFGLQSMQESWESGDYLGASMDVMGFIPGAGDGLDTLRLFFAEGTAY